MATVTDTAQPNMPALDVSPNDNRTYRLITLDNGLRALLASDPTAEHGAAAMAVDVGAAHDPTGLPGLAHFCEHMLFLGSEKYREESAYKKFLAAHGGRSNASTSMEQTTYKFEVLADHLASALDIFAQFFIAPLFTASATERELNAVDAEDARNRTVDGRRLLQVLKAAADVPQHPWAKFSTGNSTTLHGGGDATRSALLDFHGLHYVAGRMALVVLAAGTPLDALEATVRTTFASVPSSPRVPTGVAADALRAAAEAVAAGLSSPTASFASPLPSAAATAFASPSAAATAFASPPKPPLLEQRLGPLVDALNRSIPSTIDATEILQLAEEMACAAAHTAALEAASEAAHLAARAGAQLAARTVAQAAEEERAAEQQERAAAERATQRAEERAAVREAEHESRAREGQRGRTELGQQLERAHAAHAEALARAAEQARAATRATEEAEARAAAAQAEANARRAEAAQLRAELESAHAQNQAVLALAAEQASEQAARAAQQQRQAVEQATRAARARAGDEVAAAREAAEAATDGLLKAQAQLAEAGRRHQALLDELPVTIRAVVDMALARDLRSELAAGVQHALAQLMPQMQRETEAALRAEASSSSRGFETV